MRFSACFCMVVQPALPQKRPQWTLAKSPPQCPFAGSGRTRLAEGLQRDDGVWTSLPGSFPTLGVLTRPG